MIVAGVYWYYGFPENLYSYRFFKFRRGHGGHADNPADLVANIICENADEVIAQLKQLIELRSCGFLQICRSGNEVQISTGGYHVFDYDFELIKSVESILSNNGGQNNPSPLYNNAERFQFVGTQLLPIHFPTPKFIQVVSSEPKKNNAEVQLLRIDCHMDISRKSEFINALRDRLVQSAISVFYYYESSNGSIANLMLFVTNGRQGVAFASIQYVDLAKLETDIHSVLIQYHVSVGHHKDIPYPAGSNRQVVLIVDDEFIL